MYFNIEINDEIAIQMTGIAKNMDKSVNNLIYDVLLEWLQHQPKQIPTQWSSKVLTFKGIKDFPRFESYRTELQAPSQDPLT